MADIELPPPPTEEDSIGFGKDEPEWGRRWSAAMAPAPASHRNSNAHALNSLAPPPAAGGRSNSIMSDFDANDVGDADDSAPAWGKPMGGQTDSDDDEDEAGDSISELPGGGRAFQNASDSDSDDPVEAPPMSMMNWTSDLGDMKGESSIIGASADVFAAETKPKKQEKKKSKVNDDEQMEKSMKIMTDLKSFDQQTRDPSDSTASSVSSTSTASTSMTSMSGRERSPTDCFQNEDAIDDPFESLSLTEDDRPNSAHVGPTSDKFYKEAVLSKYDPAFYRAEPWAKRYFVLRSFDCEVFLVCYRSEGVMKELGRVRVANASLDYFACGDHDLVHEWVWGITGAGESTGYLVGCQTKNERREWLLQLRKLGALAKVEPTTRSRLLSESVQEGFLMKQGGKAKAGGWRTRFFILSQNPKPQIVYFKSRAAAAKSRFQGIIRLDSTTQVGRLTRKEMDELDRPDMTGFFVQTRERKYLLCGNDAAHVNRWLNPIEETVEGFAFLTQTGGRKGTVT